MLCIWLESAPCRTEAMPATKLISFMDSRNNIYWTTFRRAGVIWWPVNQPFHRRTDYEASKESNSMVHVCYTRSTMSTWTYQIMQFQTSNYRITLFCWTSPQRGRPERGHVDSTLILQEVIQHPRCPFWELPSRWIWLEEMLEACLGLAFTWLSRRSDSKALWRAGFLKEFLHS